MAYAKAYVDFTKNPEGDLKGIATAVHDLMLVTNAAVFTGAPYTAVAFAAIILAWDGAVGDAQYGGKDRTNTKNVAGNTLLGALNQLGTFANLTAKGDQTIIDQSGFPSYTTEKAPSGGPVTFIPQNVRWEDGTGATQEILRWKGDGTRANYDVGVCLTDPNVEANWTGRGAFSGGRAVLNGFTPGTKIWGRVRKIGTGGQYGDWSDPAQTMAT